MKQSDIFSIIIISVVGTLASYFAVNSLLGDPNLQIVSIKTIDPISSSLLSPDPELFNPDAINPTVEVFISGCVDADQNGILSPEELADCEKTGDSGTDGLIYCDDGTAVLDSYKCPENKKDELEQGLVPEN